MRDFFSDEFLLDSPLAVNLYTEHAVKKPIFDYHCHLSAKEIYEDVQFSSLGELWLNHDHYKWRLIRSRGIDEKYVTGEGDIYKKYLIFIDTLYYAMGNPVLHWSYRELNDIFKIREVLTKESALRIWNKTKKIINEKKLSPRKILSLYNVRGLCTTEDVSADLGYHEKLKKEWKECMVLPAWRPDRILNVNSQKFIDEIHAIEKHGYEIKSYQDFLAAVIKRMDDFDNAGCVASDHDLNAFVFNMTSEDEMSDIFLKIMKSETLTKVEIQRWKCTLLVFLFSEYKKRNWVVELHAGCNRNQNMKMVRKVGEACGYDTPGDFEMSLPIGELLNYLEENGILTKIILFSLNPKDLWPLASLCYTFHETGVDSKIQLGAAWWMQDHKKGMIEQMDALANTGLLGGFIGMLTDSRSFLSYSRHDYFRRILCSYIASYYDRGEYPYTEMLGKLCEDISYNNVIKYFLK
ncbi:glucuronate isomerase [Treponema sp. OMZ 840]|uniref:glucuronate isomerase n=1 Tax=Treponema sp. OMZ 840 TaxID=244313 RepID=UPI003D90708F